MQSHPLRYQHGARALLTLLCCSLLAAPDGTAEVIVDGNAGSEEGYTRLHTQGQATVWGVQNALTSLRAVQVANNDNLYLLIGGRVTGNAMILFVDAKPGGVNRITPGLIAPQAGGEEVYINRLALDATHGMTFESGFEPELAIRFAGNEIDGAKSAVIECYDLIAGTRLAIGDSHTAIVAGGPIRAARTLWQNVPPSQSNYGSFTSGVELALNLSQLGVAAGTTPVKFSAILIDADSRLGSNQVLGSLSNNYAMGTNGNVTTVNFQTEPAVQTLSVTVTGLDPAGDADGDNLPNSVETGTGVFVSASDTGSDPYRSDTDGDGYLDGAEVAVVPSLGYPSNPNIPNYTNMAVPGSFNLPNPWIAVSSANVPSNAMVQESTGLTGQYRWLLDYKFVTSQLGDIAYKFTTNGSFDTQWGGGTGVGTVARGGYNFANYVAATGYYRFVFDQAALTYQFERRTFADVAAFLTAYGLAAGSDADGDGIPNEDEFAGNTDPTNRDSDDDGLDDLVDVQPLSAVRDIVFSVDMHIQRVNQSFFPEVGDTVKAVFLAGKGLGTEVVLTDPDGDDIYTGTLAAVEGVAGSSYGEYQFYFLSNYYGGFYEFIPNRNCVLGTAQTLQVLPVVFFNDAASSYAYDNWCNGFATNPGLLGDDPDGDGFTNYVEFLFGTSPLVATAVLVPAEHSTTHLTLRWLERATGAGYRLEQSTTLAAGEWTNQNASVSDDYERPDVPEGYVAKIASIPLTERRGFFRVAGRE